MSEDVAKRFEGRLIQMLKISFVVVCSTSHCQTHQWWYGEPDDKKPEDKKDTVVRPQYIRVFGYRLEDGILVFLSIVLGILCIIRNAKAPPPDPPG